MSSSEAKPRRFYQTKTCRLCAMLSLTLSFFVVELVVGNLTKSVALVADAFHMLSDVISLVIGIVAVRFSRRKSNINTYGWVRAEVVGANINSVFLLALCLTIVFDVIRRFIEPETIENVDLFHFWFFSNRRFTFGVVGGIWPVFTFQSFIDRQWTLLKCYRN